MCTELCNLVVASGGVVSEVGHVPVNFFDSRLPERFWQKVIPEPNSGCWLWLGAARRTGYGCFWFGHHKISSAHEVAYLVLVGSVPSPLELDHQCNTRCCVNPAHLEPVTHAVNCARAAARRIGRPPIKRRPWTRVIRLPIPKRLRAFINA